MSDSKNEKIDRQAVIVIHGIGSQRPMDTLRSFVDAIFDFTSKENSRPPYYSKPDFVSSTFEMRRLQSRESRPRTDFFELYWQHLVPMASWGIIWSWLRRLILRSNDDVPLPLRRIIWVSRVICGAILALMIISAISWLYPQSTISESIPGQSSSLPAFAGLLLIVLQSLILNSVGDAAIYLSPTPANIKARQAVREAGVALIKRLHSDVDGIHKYDRIIIVGHSLGSVIGYDILTYAWPLFNDRHSEPESPEHEMIKNAKRSAIALGALIEGEGSGDLATRKNDWFAAVRKLWIEQSQGNGFPWLITDFITLGSPLTYASFLMAKDKKDFDRKKKDFEMLASPPEILDGNELWKSCHYETENNEKRTVLALHHGSLFAVTKWTNLYFPVRYGIVGDIIGGPLEDLFGRGINDVSVKTNTRYTFGVSAHTKYWEPHKDDVEEGGGAIAELKKALDLDLTTFKFSKGTSSRKRKTPA